MGDWLELYNDAEAAHDISGYTLIDREDLAVVANRSLVFPGGSFVPARGYVIVVFLEPNQTTSQTSVVTRTGTTVSVFSTSLFRLDNSGETVTLATAGGELVDRVTFLSYDRSGSAGRLPDGSDRWFAFAAPTRGWTNNGSTSNKTVVVRDADWRAESHSVGPPRYETVFDDSALQVVELVFEGDQWNKSWADVQNATRTANPVLVWVTVRFRQRVWRHVAFRFKGARSLKQSVQCGMSKLPFRLDFDAFEHKFPEIENQRFFGFGKLTFASNFGDNTGMRELLMQHLYASMDVPVARSAPVQVVLERGDDDVRALVGIFTMIEEPNDSDGFLRRVFNDSVRRGNLYEPDGEGGRFTLPLNTTTIDRKGRVGWGDDQFTDLKAVASALHASTRITAAPVWRADLERTFDVDVFLRWLAVTRASGNWAQYGAYLPHNYFIYCSIPATPCRWIAWDGHFVFGASLASVGIATGASSCGTSELSLPMMGGPDVSPKIDLSDVNAAKWPLIAFTARDDPIYSSRYKAALVRLLTDPASLIGNTTAFDAFVTKFDALFGAQQALEQFPFSSLANGTTNAYKADVARLRTFVGQFRAALVDATTATSVQTGTTELPSSNAARADPQSQSDAAIVGGVVGGVLGLLLVCLVLFLVWRRSRRAKDVAPHQAKISEYGVVRLTSEPEYTVLQSVPQQYDSVPNQTQR